MRSKIKDLPGRPRVFDHDVVLTKAMNVFWSLGFSRTTYAELENATGLHRQSLIYAFGDKKALFNQALNHYAATRVQAVINQLEASGSPLDNIRAVFSMWVEDARCQAKPGCLFVNTSAEIGQFEPAIAQLIENSTQRLIQAFAQAFQVGQARGEITTQVDAAALARQAVAVGDGALLRSKTSTNSAFAEAAFQAFIALISNK
ncbi:TetR/AcrR family transcriptional regulator [Nostocales cyanobacterium LEGE 11386]|nr:TetR/AcrR family transcriptional regulator [Nostocales cyanobacterium LEGE 11386]